jgi:hypothetical protein
LLAAAREEGAAIKDAAARERAGLVDEARAHAAAAEVLVAARDQAAAIVAEARAEGEHSGSARGTVDKRSSRGGSVGPATLSARTCP